jgi:Chromo (CHRromatin Organisation MOdifier) domain
MSHVFNEEKGETILEWEVEEILDVATIDGELHYMVLWKGHLIEECTWETVANLANSGDAIDDFYVAFPTKRRGLGVAKKGKKKAAKSDA